VQQHKKNTTQLKGCFIINLDRFVKKKIDLCFKKNILLCLEMFRIAGSCNLFAGGGEVQAHAAERRNGHAQHLGEK
jgi:hypothetical protein